MYYQFYLLLIQNYFKLGSECAVNTNPWLRMFLSLDDGCERGDTRTVSRSICQGNSALATCFDGFAIHLLQFKLRCNAGSSQNML